MIPEYIDASGGFPDEEDVHAALAYLVSIEPDPQPSTYDEYKTALAPYETQISRASSTLRTFAEQMQPASLDEMQYVYYRFTNDARYLTSTYIAATVTAYLNEAWNGIGSWQR